jgi:VWFA-related protein
MIFGRYALRPRAPLALALALACLSSSAADARLRQQPSDDGDDGVTLKARLVDIDVMVRDKKGRFVTDLKPEDFTVVENGVPQKVEFLDPPSSVGVSSSASGAGGMGGPGGAGGAGVAPRNVISLLLDAQTTESTQVKRVADGTLKYIRERVAETDAVAVFRVSNGLQLLQPFTNDKTRLIAAVANGFSTHAGGLASESREAEAAVADAQSTLAALGGVDPTSAPNAKSQGDVAANVVAISATRSLAVFSKLRAQLSLQQSRPVLAALAALCDAQRGVPGKKIVVLFSEGFVTASTQDWQVQGLVDIANRANVSIYIVDSGGLTANAPAGGGPIPNTPLGGVSGAVSQESRIRASGGEDVFDNVRHEGIDRNLEILYRIADDTGGAFIKNTNDMASGLDRIDREIRSRYTLGYYTTNQNFDGAFRKVKVEVTRPGTEVDARPGYFAVAGEDVVVPLSADDKKLLAELDSAAASPSFPLFADLSPFRTAGGRYVVPLSMEVPPSAVKVARKGDKRQIGLDVLGVVRDDPTKVLSRMGGHFDVLLDDAQYRDVAQNNIFFRQDIELEPGDYTFDLIVRDRLTGKTSARRERVSLPAVDDGFSVSGVVLSKRAVPATGGETGDVLAAGGARIQPSPSRTFAASDRLIVFFDLYNPATDAAGKASVRVTLTLLKDGKPATKPVEYALADVVAAPVPHLAFAKFVALTGLPPGSYTAAIEISDPATKAVVTRRVPFVIAP